MKSGIVFNYYYRIIMSNFLTHYKPYLDSNFKNKNKKKNTLKVCLKNQRIN